LFGTILAGVVAIGAACSNNSMQGHDMSKMNKEKTAKTSEVSEPKPLVTDSVISVPLFFSTSKTGFTS
jgi:hypothetical protein